MGGFFRFDREGLAVDRAVKLEALCEYTLSLRFAAAGTLGLGVDGLRWTLSFCRRFAAFLCPFPSSYPFRSGFRFRFPEVDGVELVDDVVACNGTNGGNGSFLSFRSFRSVPFIPFIPSVRSVLSVVVEVVVDTLSVPSAAMDSSSLFRRRRDRDDFPLDLPFVLLVDSLDFEGFPDFEFADSLDRFDREDLDDLLDSLDLVDFMDFPLRCVELVELETLESAVDCTEHALSASASEGVRERANASPGGGDSSILDDGSGLFDDEPEAVRWCSFESLRFRLAFFLRFDFLRSFPLRTVSEVDDGPSAGSRGRARGSGSTVSSSRSVACCAASGGVIGGWYQ